MRNCTGVPNLWWSLVPTGLTSFNKAKFYQESLSGQTLSLINYALIPIQKRKETSGQQNNTWRGKNTISRLIRNLIFFLVNILFKDLGIKINTWLIVLVTAIASASAVLTYCTGVLLVDLQSCKEYYLDW